MSDKNNEKSTAPLGLRYEKDGVLMTRPNYVCGGCFGSGVSSKEEFKDAATGKCTSCKGHGFIVVPSRDELLAQGYNL